MTDSPWARPHPLRVLGALGRYVSYALLIAGAAQAWPGAIMSLSANICLNVLGNSCNRMYL
jgi:hypothetical protein